VFLKKEGLSNKIMLNWRSIVKKFEKEMSNKLSGLPDHREVPENLRRLRSIVSHELPETSPKKTYWTLIKLLLENKTINEGKVRERYLFPELEKEQKIIYNKKEEFEELRRNAFFWVKKNFPEEKLQKMWKNHKTWLPRRFTIYRSANPSFQKIAADTLARYYLIKKVNQE